METTTTRETRERIIALRLTAGEYAELVDAASDDDRPVSAFIRLAALLRARALREIAKGVGPSCG